MRQHLFLTAAVLMVLLVVPVPSTAGEHGQITIAAVGDIMMGTTWPENTLPPGDGFGIFSEVMPLLGGHDIVFGNLEGPMLDDGKGAKCPPESTYCFEFRMPTRYVQKLKNAGFTVVSIANNHAWDFGRKGIESTVKTLRAAGIKPAGGVEVATFDIQGKKVAVIGFHVSPSRYAYSVLKIHSAKQIVAKAKEKYDIVIVSFHGGAEGPEAVHLPTGMEYFLKARRGDLRAFSHGVIDAGADLVLGHGPHVLRGMEVYKEKLIAYSMGNFLTYGMFKTGGPNGVTAVLSITLDTETGNFVKGTLSPLRLTHDGVPYQDKENTAINTISRLTAEDMPTSGLLISSDGALTKALTMEAATDSDSAISDE